MGKSKAYETANGKRYEVRYRNPEGRTTRKRGFKTKRDADLFLSSVTVKKANGEFIDVSAGRITIGALGAEWFDGQTHLKPSSLSAMRSAWVNHVLPQWGSTEVGKIRHSAVQAWISRMSEGAPNDESDESEIPRADRPKSAALVLRAYGILAGILDTAVKDRRIPSNPARGVNLPRRTKRPHRYLSHEQIETLAEAAGGMHGVIVRTLAYTGLRWGELAGLRVRDVNMLKRRLNIERTASLVDGKVQVGTPKTHRTRSVPFPAFLADDLARLCEGKGRDGVVFSDAHGGYLKTPTVYYSSWWDKALAKAGIESMTVHDLRHTAASLAISAGANVKAVQRMLGHASASMTLDTYADLFDDDLDDVAEALDSARSKSSVSKMRPKPDSVAS